MRSSQYVSIKGRLVDKPEISTSEAGKDYFKVSVAVNYSARNAEGTQEKMTTFYNVLVFGKLVDYYKNLDKGEYLRVDGSLTLKPYSSNNGEAKIDATIIADEILPIKYISSDEEKEMDESLEDANQTN